MILVYTKDKQGVYHARIGTRKVRFNDAVTMFAWFYSVKATIGKHF